MALKLPEPNRFKIHELAKRWSKTVGQILELAADGHLELCAMVSGDFNEFIEALGSTETDDKRALEITHSFDFEISDLEVIREMAKVCETEGYFNFRKRVIAEKTIDGVTYTVSDIMANWRIGTNRSQLTIEDLYVPLTSVLKVEGRSMHRVILEEMLDWNNTEKSTNLEFQEWLHSRYPTIAKSVAKNLYTFITTSHRTR